VLKNGPNYGVHYNLSDIYQTFTVPAEALAKDGSDIYQTFAVPAIAVGDGWVSQLLNYKAFSRRTIWNKKNLIKKDV